MAAEGSGIQFEFFDQEGGDAISNFITDSTKLTQSHLRRGGRGIIKRPMQCFIYCGKDRTRLLGSIADGNDVGKRLPDKFLDMFRKMVTHINTHFLHGNDRHGIESRRTCPCADNLEAVPSHVAEQSFCHLAPC